MSNLRKLKLTDVQIQSMSYSSGSEVDGGSLDEVVCYGSKIDKGSGSASGSSSYGSSSSPRTCLRCGARYDDWGQCPNCDYSSSGSDIIDGGSYPDTIIYGSWRGSGSGDGNYNPGGGGGYWNPGGGNTNPPTEEQNPPTEEEEPPTPNPERKKPQERTDCSADNAIQGNKVQKMKKTGNVEKAIVDLHTGIANGDTIEKGHCIFYDKDTKEFNASNVTLGERDKIALSIYPDVAYHVHSHPRIPYMLIGPSPGDIGKTAEYYKDIKELKGDYKGMIVVTHDKSEFLISINDEAGLNEFCKDKNIEQFFGASNDCFPTGSKFQDVYDTVRKQLEADNYSKSDAMLYALSYVLDEFNTGMKISQKKDGESTYKELKTEKREVNGKTIYIALRCP